MNNVCIICVYFGKMPASYNVWLDSCHKNEKIDFILVSDQFENKVDGNFRYIHMTLLDFKTIITNTLQMDIKLENPKKCCDYKPLYGLVFEEYLKPYLYWGNCDMDMVFGDIYHFLEKNNFQQYDKFLPLGHLTLYRNTIENNNRFKLDCSTENYIEAFSTDENMIFDERSICNIYDEYAFPVFKERIFADISPRNKRFKLSQNDTNYKKQIFVYEYGKIYRIFFENCKEFRDEFLYIHFQARKNMLDYTVQDAEKYIICDRGFICYDNENYSDLIDKYNKYFGISYEKIENIYHWIRRRTRNLMKRIETKKNTLRKIR